MLACEKQFNQKLYYTLCSDSTKMKYHFVKAVAAAILTNACNNSANIPQGLINVIITDTGLHCSDPNHIFEISLASRAFKCNH